MRNIDAIVGAMPPETMRSMLQQSRQYQAIMPKSDTPSLLEQSEKLERLIADAPKNNPAKWAYEQLKHLVKEFEADLDDEHETGIKIANVGSPFICYVDEIDYWSPYILAFHCHTEEGLKTTLIQHHSQLNFLLVVLPKHDSHKPAKRIGFRPHTDDDDEME